MKIHIVKKGDTLYEIAKKNHVELNQLIAANPHISDPDNLVVGLKVKIPLAHKPTPVPPADYIHKHVIVQGDTLWKLSKEWNVPLKAIIDANPHIKNPSVLMTGDVVYIPKLTANEPAPPMHIHHGDPKGTAQKAPNKQKMAGLPAENVEPVQEAPVKTKPFNPEPNAMPPAELQPAELMPEAGEKVEKIEKAEKVEKPAVEPQVPTVQMEEPILTQKFIVDKDLQAEKSEKIEKGGQPFFPPLPGMMAPEAQQPQFDANAYPYAQQPQFDANAYPYAQQPQFDANAYPYVQLPQFDPNAHPQAQQPQFDPNAYPHPYTQHPFLQYPTPAVEAVAPNAFEIEVQSAKSDAEQQPLAWKDMPFPHIPGMPQTFPAGFPVFEAPVPKQAGGCGCGCKGASAYELPYALPHVEQQSNEPFTPYATPQSKEPYGTAGNPGALLPEDMIQPELHANAMPSMHHPLMFPPQTGIPYPGLEGIFSSHAVAGYMAPCYPLPGYPVQAYPLHGFPAEPYYPHVTPYVYPYGFQGLEPVAAPCADKMAEEDGGEGRAAEGEVSVNSAPAAVAAEAKENEKASGKTGSKEKSGGQHAALHAFLNNRKSRSTRKQPKESSPWTKF